MQQQREDTASDIGVRIRAITEQLERARFAGAGPQIVVPAGADASEIVAHALAAERQGALLLLDGQTHALHDDRAREALQSAQVALGRWSFSAAEASLKHAAGMAIAPDLQQRLAIWQALAALLRRLIRTHPDERLRGDPLADLMGMVASADQLSSAERTHSQAEASRLLMLHRAAAEQPDGLERALWLVARTRLAMPGDDPLAGLAWCLRLSRAFAHRLPAEDAYLSGLLRQARNFGLLQFGELDEATAAEVEASTAKLQVWDLYRALTAHLGVAFGMDLQRETIRLTIAPYQQPDNDDD